MQIDAKNGSQALGATQVVKRFGGALALNGVTFDVRYGEVHAICGENGAGKSTLINILSGVYPAGDFEGEVCFEGAPVRFGSIADSQSRGIAVIHQELALVDSMTVAENIFLGEEPQRRGFINWDALFTQAAAVLRQVGADLQPDARVGSLGIGRKQQVEIAKAMSRRSRILILDEPTAALADREVATLLELLRHLRAQGVACVYISHRLEEVFELADRITILRDGCSVGTHDRRDTDRSAVIRAMVGRELTHLFPRVKPPLGEIRLDVTELDVAPSRGEDPWLQAISFHVRAGEVLGIGGLMGAGRTELLKHLFGSWGERRAGEVKLDGKAFFASGPAEAVLNGVVYVSEDRLHEGLVIGESIGFNTTLSALRNYVRGIFLDHDLERSAADRQIKSLGMKASGLEQTVGFLSGGNQQKVVLAKALLAEPKVLLLDEPTRGIDVGAKHEIYELINRLTAAGMAVIMVSSELPELMGMSDRLIMLHDGRASREFKHGDATQEELLAAAMGETSGILP